MRSRMTMLALFLFALGLAASSSAVPLLVELTIKDPVGSLENGSSPVQDEFVKHGKGGGNGKGSGSTTDLKSLTLWLSTNGKDWTKVSNDLISYAPDKITAEINTKGKNDLFGSAPGDITGESGQAYYIGLSTSSSSYAAGGKLSARLVSWNYASKTGTPSTPTTPSNPSTPSTPSRTVPEPAAWLLFAAGILAIGFAFRKRHRA